MPGNEKCDFAVMKMAAIKQDAYRKILVNSMLVNLTFEKLALI